MKKIRNHLFLQTIAGYLALTLLAPNSAWALRPMGIENAGLEDQLTEALSPGVSLRSTEEIDRWVDAVDQQTQQLIRKGAATAITEVYGGGAVWWTSQGPEVQIRKWMDSNRWAYAVQNGPFFFVDQLSQTGWNWVGNLPDLLGPNLIWVERLGESELGEADLAPYTHTTLAALRRLDLHGKLVVESGAGHGIPVIAALREGGASFVLVIEKEADLLKAAGRNLEANGYQTGVHFHLLQADIQEPQVILSALRGLRRPEKEAVLLSNIGNQPKAYEVSNFESAQLIPWIEKTEVRVTAFLGAGEEVTGSETRAALERDQEYLSQRFGFQADPEEVRLTDHAGVSAVAWIARRPPAAGLEEDVVEFVYDPNDRRARRLDANRQNFERIELGNWIPPLTAWEAAALNAFVYGRLEGKHSQLPFLSQAVGGDGRLRPAQIKAFQVTLRQDEAAAYLNRLYDLQTAVGGFNPERIEAYGRLWFETEILAPVRQKRRKAPGKWSRWFAQQEIQFWRDQFRSVLAKTLNRRSEGKPFAVVVSRRVGESYYQEVPPGGQIEIPWKAVGEGIRLRIDGAEFDLKAVRPETEGTSLWPWKLEGRRFPVVRREPDGTYSLTAQIVGNHSHSVPLSGPMRFSASPQEVVAQVGARKLRFRRKEELVLYILRLGHQELPILVERPVEQLARDLMPLADQQVEALLRPRHQLLPDDAILLALEIVEQVVDQGRPFNRWIDLGRFLRETLENSGGEMLLLNNNLERAVILRMAKILERSYPAGGSISDYGRADEWRIQSLGFHLESFRSQHKDQGPAQYLNGLLEKNRGSSEREKTGLEERARRAVEFDLPQEVSLGVGSLKYTDERVQRGGGLRDY